MGPGTLAQVLRPLAAIGHPNLLVGLQTSDDAAVFKLRDDLLQPGKRLFESGGTGRSLRGGGFRQRSVPLSGK